MNLYKVLKHVVLSFIVSILILSGVCIRIPEAERTSFCLQVHAEETAASVLTDTSGKVNVREADLYSVGAVLMDAQSGRVLYGKGADLQLPMASTTKIMTCIIALEYGDLEDVVTASAYAAAQPKVKLYLSKGEQNTLEDLLYSMMLESHNDSAAAVAEHIGSLQLGWDVSKEAVESRTASESMQAIKAFARLMNEKAREIGCQDTWFITPNGLDATETFTLEDGSTIEKIHSTTAADLARIMSYCILHSPKAELFLKITGTYQYRFQDIDGSHSYACSNHNAFLSMMNGAISGKTGYTGNAGYCYVGALKDGDRYFVVALLNSGAYGNKERKWKDVRILMQYGLDHFQEQTIFDGALQTEDVRITEGKTDVFHFWEEAYSGTKVEGMEPVKLLLADWESYEVTWQQEHSLAAPVKAGDKVGEVNIYLENALYKQYDIILTENVDKKTIMDTIEYIIHQFLFKKCQQKD